MSRITPKTIDWLVERLARLTGDTLRHDQHTTMGGWLLWRESSGARNFGPYGMPTGRTQPAQFVAHLKQALWAAEELSRVATAVALERVRLRRVYSEAMDFQSIELHACSGEPMVPGPEAPAVPGIAEQSA